MLNQRVSITSSGAPASIAIAFNASFIDNSLCKNGYPRRQASITNLKTKGCDLIVVCVDGDLEPTHSNYIRILHLPVTIWKQYWKSDSHSLSFGSQDKWYKNYRIC